MLSIQNHESMTIAKNHAIMSIAIRYVVKKSNHVHLSVICRAVLQVKIKVKVNVIWNIMYVIYHHRVVNHRVKNVTIDHRVQNVRVVRATVVLVAIIHRYRTKRNAKINTTIAKNVMSRSTLAIQNSVK